MTEQWDDKFVAYIYDETGAPIGMQYRTSSYAEGVFDYFYFEKNLQGDIIAVYNASGTKLVTYKYDAWGNHTATYSNGGGSTGAQYNPFRYRGYYYDSDMGFYYLNDRYYDSITGRFLTPDDPSYLGANGDLLSYNLFAYCSNNPVMYVDPTGHMPEWAKWAIGGLAIVGLVVATVLTCGVAGAGTAAVGSAMLAGGVISGGLDLIDQLNDTGTVDWTKVAISTLSGTAFGLVVGLTGGAGIGAVAGKFAVAGGTSLLNSCNNWSEESTVGGVFVSLGTSLLATGAAYGVGRIGGKYVPKLFAKLFHRNPNHWLTLGDIGSAVWSISAVKTGGVKLGVGIGKAVFNDFDWRK